MSSLSQTEAVAVDAGRLGWAAHWAHVVAAPDDGRLAAAWARGDRVEALALVDRVFEPPFENFVFNQGPTGLAVVIARKDVGETLAQVVGKRCSNAVAVGGKVAAARVSKAPWQGGCLGVSRALALGRPRGRVDRPALRRMVPA